MDMNPVQKEMRNTQPNPNALAVDRTRLAAERTLMAWVRTALSMIGFGFTIYKFMQVFLEESTRPVLHPQSPRNVGLALISIGTFALIIASVQHFKYMRSLNPSTFYKFWVDLSFIVACLLTLLGLLMFGSIVLRAGFLG
jgi:putative membrane protein